MKIRTISYQKMFPLAPYINERLGIEIELDDTDKVENAYQLAKELVEAHKTPIQSQNETVLSPVSTQEYKSTTPILKPPVNKRENQIEDLKRDIGTCADEKVLETYNFFLKTYPELQETYDNKLKELIK